MRSRFLLLLTAVAEVGALLPIIMVVDHLIPLRSITPLLVLLVWFGGWWIGAKASSRRMVLSPPLLLVGALLAWPGGWSAMAQNPLGLIPILVPFVGAWWGGSQIGIQWLSWHSAFEGLRRSIWVCLGGLALMLFVGSLGPSAFLGPLILFGTALPLLYLLRLGASGYSANTTFFALAPLIVVVLLAFLTSPQVVGAVLHPILQILSAILTAILVSLAYVISPIMNGLINLLRRGFSRLPPPPPQECPNQQSGEPCPHPQHPPQNLPAAAGPDLRPYVAALLIIGLVLAVFFLTKLLHKQKQAPSSEELDEVRSGPGLLKGLLQDLRSLFHARVVEPVLMALAPGDPRWLLRRLQAWGARRGRTRRPGETPLQYAQALRPELPQGADPNGLDALTAAYEEARYGSGTPNPSLVTDANALLGRLEERS